MERDEPKSIEEFYNPSVLEANELISQLRAYRQRVTQTPETARKALRDAGLIDEQDNPTMPYRS